MRLCNKFNYAGDDSFAKEKVRGKSEEVASREAVQIMHKNAESVA